MTSIHELRARRAKAEAIVSAFLDSLEPEQRVDPETVRLFRACSDQKVRDDFARVAGQRSPSDETWTLAGNILAQRIADTRWGAERSERLKERAG